MVVAMMIMMMMMMMEGKGVESSMMINVVGYIRQ